MAERIFRRIALQAQGSMQRLCLSGDLEVEDLEKLQEAWVAEAG